MPIKQIFTHKAEPIYHLVKRLFTRNSYRILRFLKIRPTEWISSWLLDYTTVLAIAQSNISVDESSSDVSGDNILFFTSLSGILDITSLEFALYRMLQKRGYNCDVIICDQFMDLCDLMSHKQSSKTQNEICKRCIIRGKDAFDAAGIEYKLASKVLLQENHQQVKRLESRIGQLEFDELKQLMVDSVPVGAIAEASALRYLRRGTWPEHIDSKTLDTLRGFLRSAIRIKFLAESYLLQNSKPEFVVMTHGIYVPWGPARSVFERENIPVACYDRSTVFKQAYVASWNRPSQSNDIAQPFDDERGEHLSDKERNTLHDYLASRRNNSRDRTKFNFIAEESRKIVREKLDIPHNAVCFGIFTNLLWDAATVARDSCFNNQIDWVINTVKYFIQQPNKYLLVRPHPAEMLRGTQQAIVDEILKHFSHLPENIILLNQETPFNSYSIYDAIDVGIVNTSTVGLEMSLLGKVVVVISETHYREMGFTLNPDSDVEYFEMLESVLPNERLQQSQIDEAERYAYMWFFRHHTRLGFFEENRSGNAILRAQMDNHDYREVCDAWIDSLVNKKAFVIPRDLVRI